jgi:hypothetical protein
MTRQEMQAALAEMLNQWDKAKAIAAAEHPEWTADQVNQAVGNAMTAALRAA